MIHTQKLFSCMLFGACEICFFFFTKSWIKIEHFHDRSIKFMSHTLTLSKFELSILSSYQNNQNVKTTKTAVTIKRTLESTPIFIHLISQCVGNCDKAIP